MTTPKRTLGALAALALAAAACGSNAATDSADDATESADDAMEEPAGDEEPAADDAMEEPAGDTTAGEGGNLVLLQWQAPSQANSLLSNGTKDLLAGSLVLEPLAEIDPAGELVPALATEIPSVDNGGLSEDGTQVTWNLRDDVMWSDGTPFTADDVVFTWEYCADEGTGCSVEVFTDVTSVEAIDDTTVTVTFAENKPYPFEPFVAYNSPIIQRAQFADCVGADAVGCSDQNFAPIGTGPYTITELRPEDAVTYEMNPNYRGVADGQPFFSTVEIRGGGDAEAAARSVLEVGEADYAWNLQVAPEILAPMEAAGNGVLAAAFASNVEHINLNLTDPDGNPPSEGAPNPIFADNPDLHKALSIAINRDELVQVGYGPAGEPTCNLWPVGEQSTNNDECLTQDIEGANALLDGLGYVDSDGDGIREADGYGPLEFDFVTSTNAVRQSNQELIANYWAQIGVGSNMRNEDASLFFDGTCASDVCIWKFFTDIQMFSNGATGGPYGPGYLNGYESAKIPTPGSNWGGDNIPRMNNEAFDALAVEARATDLSDPRLNEIVIEMNDIVSTSAVMPLIFRASNSAFATSIQGYGDLNGWDSEFWNIEQWTRTS